MSACAERAADRADPLVDSSRPLAFHDSALPFAAASGLPAADEIPETETEQGQTGEVLRLQDSASKLDSFDLCLYALVGLGLCRSSHLVKRPSLGFVPEWYHSGAPQQIGHSHAVGPDAFCFAAVCFVQPDSEVDPDIPEHRPGTITSRWRCSQFTPSVLASRAPPA